MDSLRTSFVSHIHGPIVLLFLLVIVALVFAFRDNNQDSEHQKTGDLTVGGVLYGGRRQIIPVTGAATSVTVAQSRALFDLRYGEAAANIYLPEITKDNVGVYYDFHVAEGNANGYTIHTDIATQDAVTGDIFLGTVMLASNSDTNTAAGVCALTSLRSENNTKILLKDSTTAGDAGTSLSLIRCTAIEFGTSPTAQTDSSFDIPTSKQNAHSIWLVEGHVNTASVDNTITGANVFA